MKQRTTRDYEVSLWSLQDSFITVLKQYGLEFKGQIQDGKLSNRDDGTQTFSFTIPMYYYKNGQRIENPSWYSVTKGALLANMRKIKVIFNKDAEDSSKIQVYQFLIVKVKERHEDAKLFCDVECEGLAFHELGKIGYKITLSADDFYNDDYDWATNGEWTDSYGTIHTEQPLATLNYWNDRVFSTINNWTYEIQMDWNSHSLYQVQQEGIEDDYIVTNDTISFLRIRDPHKLYEDDFVDSWKNNNEGNLVPAHITSAREKARVGINISESNIYNITQTLAELFGVFCKYEYKYDKNFHIIGRKVIYYNNFLNEKNGLIDLNYKYQTSAISREIDSTDLVTKLFVKGTENTGSEAGITSIINVGANKSEEDYILNFDYLYKSGSITEQQYNKVEDYLLNMRRINQSITPLSAKIISLQAQLPKLQAELTTRTNAITKDTEEIFANGELLNAITNNTEVLSITKSNPQTAVLIKDSNKPYDCYYIKMTQKGVYGESIHLYKTYNYSQAQLSDEILTGQIEYDESGNVIKISNLYANETDSKTVYLTYDYRPALFYERIQAIWESRLAEDTARKQELENTLAKINYSLYGVKHSYSMQNVDVSKIIDVDIYTKYQNLLKQKENLIKEFNLIMGPAIREGYWQPENYMDYGDKYSDSLRIGPNYIGRENASVGSSGNVSFLWDDQLFDGEQQLYYEYSSAQNKIAYPCINLEKHPEIISLIQKNMDKNVCFYYNNRASVEDTPYARERPAVILAPKELYLIRDLYTLDTNTNTMILNDKINEIYPNFENNYAEYVGKLKQEWTDQSYKVGYTTFYWQMLSPGENETWQNITYFEEDTTKNFGDPQKYRQYVLEQYYPYIQFTNNENYPQEIQLFETGNFTFEGCQFRLIIKNNKGMNLNNDNQWYNGITIQPTTIKLLNNEIEYQPLEQYQSQAIYYRDLNALSNVVVGFHPTTEFLLDKTAIFSLQYTRDTTGNRLSLDSWVNNNDIYSENDWITVDFNTDKNVYIKNYTQNDDGSIIYNLYFNSDNLSFNVVGSDEWRFRLYIKNAQDYLKDPETFASSMHSRIYIADTCPYYSHADISQTYVNLTESCKLQLKLYYDLPTAHFGPNGYSINDQYAIDSIVWKKIDRTITGAEATTIILGTTSDSSNNITVSSTTEPDYNLHKFYTTLTVESSNGLINNEIIHKIITNWDGFGIYPEIKNHINQNMKIPNNFASLFTFDGYCPINITSALEPSLIYPLNNIEENITYDDYTLKISGTNISNYDWVIQLLNGNIYHLTNDSPSITISNNTYTSVLNNTDVKLTITIPRVDEVDDTTFTNATLNSGARIYCRLWNESHRYTSIIPGTSQVETSICNIATESLFNLYELFEDELKVVYWWPSQNGDGSRLRNLQIPFAIAIQNIFNQTKEQLESALSIRVERSTVIDLTGIEENIMPENIQFSSPTTTDAVYATIDNFAFQQSVINNTYLFGKYLTLTPPRTLNEWGEVIHYINPTSTVEDKKWGYFYKVIVSYSDPRILSSEKITYVKVIIRQSPPEFVQGSKWKPTNNWSAVGEYESDLTLTFGTDSGTTLTITDNNKFTWGSGRIYTVTGNTGIFIKNFGFNEASVDKYYWRLNSWYGHKSEISGSYLQGWTYDNEAQVRNENKVNPVTLIPEAGIPATGKTQLSDTPVSTGNSIRDIIYQGIMGTQHGGLTPRIACTISQGKVIHEYNTKHDYIRSLPDGILDTYYVKDQATHVQLAQGLHKNLYLQATNAWGTTRTKTWTVNFAYDSTTPLTSNQSIVLVYDTNGAIKYIIHNYDYKRGEE